MLDEVAGSGAVCGDILEEPTHHLQLVVAGPDLLLPDLLGVVLDDVGKALWRQGLLPEVVGPEPLGVGRVSGASIRIPFVEGQEDGFGAGELGAEPDLVLVHGHVGGAAARPEQVFPGIPVLPVLLNRILHRLLGEVVLEFEGQDGEAVDEQHQVQGEARGLRAVMDLPGHGEAVQGVEGCGLLVAWAGGAVEEADAVGTVVDALPEDVDDAAAADLPVEALEELSAGVVVLVQLEGLCGLRLGVVQKSRQVGCIHAVGG